MAGSRAALARVAGRDEALTGALATLAEAVEPAKWYARVGADPRGRTVATPLNRLVDAVPAQSLAARRFTSAADDAATNPKGACEIYHSIGARFMEAWAGLLAAEHGDTSRLDTALAYFEEQQATPYVQRCRALLQQESSENVLVANQNSGCSGCRCIRLPE